MLILMDSHLSCCSIMYYYVFFTPEPLNQGGGLRSHNRFPQQQKRCYVRVFPKLLVWWFMSYLCYYVSPSNEGRHIVLVWFFLPLPLPQLLLLLLLLSEAIIIFLSFQIGQLYLVCGCMIIRRCVAYRNDLRGTLTFDLKVK
jgi:hypothetical protein